MTDANVSQWLFILEPQPPKKEFAQSGQETIIIHSSCGSKAIFASIYSQFEPDLLQVTGLLILL